MCDVLPMETTVQISGVSKRQVRHIMKLFQETGRPFIEATIKPGRPSQLTSEEVAVSAFDFPQKIHY
jgi:transposase